MITLNYKNKDALASGIVAHWTKWNNARTQACDLWAEIDAYLLATDTSMLEGGNNFDHKTHIPILSELHDDLNAIM